MTRKQQLRHSEARQCEHMQSQPAMSFHSGVTTYWLRSGAIPDCAWSGQKSGEEEWKLASKELWCAKKDDTEKKLKKNTLGDSGLPKGESSCEFSLSEDVLWRCCANFRLSASAMRAAGSLSTAAPPLLRLLLTGVPPGDLKMRNELQLLHIFHRKKSAASYLPLYGTQFDLI